MGSVHLAHDRELDRMVAVKTVTGLDADACKRFAREARSLARLSHPGVLGVYEMGDSPEGPYLVMEYVDGETLRDRLHQLGALPLPMALSLADRLLSGLAHAHRHGIVHRDVKPENMLLPQAGGLKLADFGLARAIDPAGEIPVTGTGMIMGTPWYLSPEQATGQAATALSDVYAAGIVVHEMLTGRVPFPGPAVLDILEMHVRAQPPDPREARPDLPAALAAAVTRALAKSSADRWPGAEAFRSALERGARRASAPVAASTRARVGRPPDGPGRRVLPVGAAAATAVAAALALALAVGWRAGVQRGAAGLPHAGASVCPGAGSADRNAAAPAAPSPRSALVPRPEEADAHGLLGAIGDLAPRKIIEAIAKALGPIDRSAWLRDPADTAARSSRADARMADLREHWARLIARAANRTRLEERLARVGAERRRLLGSGSAPRLRRDLLLALHELIDLKLFCAHFRIPLSLSSPLLVQDLGQRTAPASAAGRAVTLVFSAEPGSRAASLTIPGATLVDAGEPARFHTGMDVSPEDVITSVAANRAPHRESRIHRIDLPLAGQRESIELFARCRELIRAVRFVVRVSARAGGRGEAIAVLRWRDASPVDLHQDVTGLVPEERPLFVSVEMDVLPYVSGDEAAYLHALGITVAPSR
jgi:hypothetical protein